MTSGSVRLFLVNRRHATLPVITLFLGGFLQCLDRTAWRVELQFELLDKKEVSMRRKKIQLFLLVIIQVDAWRDLNST